MQDTWLIKHCSDGENDDDKPSTFGVPYFQRSPQVYSLLYILLMYIDVWLSFIWCIYILLLLLVVVVVV